MDLHLVGKTALVSGSTAGIGLAIASGLALEGATVYLNGRTEARVKQAMAQVEREGPAETNAGHGRRNHRRPGKRRGLRGEL